MAEYSASFFELTAEASRRGAQLVLPLVIDLLHPESVVDVGCGTGEWLAIVRQYGIEDILGVDGEWIPSGRLRIPAEQFLRMDLRQGLRLRRTFGLAICVEVAEHLPDGASAGLVAGLTSAAPAVLFSAAIPEQGGTGHINEQWPTYWVSRFAAHDYVLINCLRSRVWTDGRIPPYLAQNLVLFVSRAKLNTDARLRVEWERSQDIPIDVVHPGVYVRSLEQLALRRLPGFLSATVRFAKRRLRGTQ